MANSWITSGEKFCRNPPMKSSELSPPSTEISLFNPELPPVATAVMRAFVGSEGSTGSVPGARKAMFAKLRCAKGKVCKSWRVITPWCTTLAKSMG
jgi:hypothetical protein